MADFLDWAYTTTALYASLAEGKITVEVSNLHSNLTDKLVKL